MRFSNQNFVCTSRFPIARLFFIYRAFFNIPRPKPINRGFFLRRRKYKWSFWDPENESNIPCGLSNDWSILICCGERNAPLSPLFPPWPQCHWITLRRFLPFSFPPHPAGAEIGAPARVYLRYSPSPHMMVSALRFAISDCITYCFQRSLNCICRRRYRSDSVPFLIRDRN
jgi:hypothetical protein